jgi:hypothetical protein
VEKTEGYERMGLAIKESVREERGDPRETRYYRVDNIKHWDDMVATMRCMRE